MTVPAWVGKVDELDATGFNRVTRTNTGPLLLYIGAPWCPPCTTMGPSVEAAAQAMGERIRFVKLNAATDSQLLSSLKVAAVPMLVLYGEYGRELGRFLGALSASDITRWIEARLEEPTQQAIG